MYGHPAGFLTIISLNNAVNEILVHIAQNCGWRDVFQKMNANPRIFVCIVLNLIVMRQMKRKSVENVEHIKCDPMH